MILKKTSMIFLLVVIVFNTFKHQFYYFFYFYKRSIFKRYILKNLWMPDMLQNNPVRLKRGYIDKC